MFAGSICLILAKVCRIPTPSQAPCAAQGIDHNSCSQEPCVWRGSEKQTGTLETGVMAEASTGRGKAEKRLLSPSLEEQMSELSQHWPGAGWRVSQAKASAPSSIEKRGSPALTPANEAA